MFEDIKAVVFDLDGTLYDNTGVGLRLVKGNPLHAFKMKKERSVRKSFKGVFLGSSEKYYDAYACALAGLKGDASVSSSAQKKKQKVMDWYYGFYLEAMNRVIARYNPAHPDVEEVVGILKSRGIRVGVLSDYEKSEEKLRLLGLDPALFDAVVSSGDFGGLKPCRQCFEGMASLLGVDSASVLVVGDRNDTDGDGARSCGMRFVQIKTRKAVKKAIKNESSGKPSGLLPDAVEWNEFSSRLRQELQN